MLYLLIITYLAAAALFYFSVPFWVKRDVAAWNVDPTNDVFHQTWHRQRLTWRIAFALVVAALASLPYLPNWPAYLLSLAALLTGYAGYWLYAFNPQLNLARKLAYVREYYVNFDPNAAFFPDRLLADHARRVFPEGPLAVQQRYASECYPALLTTCLWLGLSVSLALAVAAGWVALHS